MTIQDLKTDQIYINGQWQDADGSDTIDILNPATEEKIAEVPYGSHKDIDEAVVVAKAAFPQWNDLSVDERADYLSQLADALEDQEERMLDLVQAEVGVTKDFGMEAQVRRSPSEIRALINNLDQFDFIESHDGYDVVKEGAGVVACITPWNYPLNQIQRKVTPALLAGNTVVVNPPSSTPLAGYLLAELIDQVGFPKGVFNYVTGAGSDTGDYLAGHEDVAVISFTGSTKVGKGLYEKAGTTVKKLILELGGKSPMVFLEGGDLERAVKTSMDTILNNTGQSCSALTRLLVPEDRLDDAKAAISAYYEEHAIVGSPQDPDTVVGPLFSAKQKERVEGYIEKGKEEGATVFLGGEKLEGPGYFVQPTIFTDVDNSMTIAQEEIFGPVLCVITYKDLEDAIEIANDTQYGLSGGVEGPEDEAYDVALQLKTGNILVNGNGRPDDALFGGYKQSGLGREVGLWGLEDYLEEKAIFY